VNAYSSYTSAVEYDQWFDTNVYAFQSEVEAIRRWILPNRRGIDIGTGTGRFANAIGIHEGIEPSRPMAMVARQKGIDVRYANAESLPFGDGRYDFALLNNVVCFVNNVGTVLSEARRVLRARGRLIVGFIDRDSPLGASYVRKKTSSKFYRAATFFSAAEIFESMKTLNFRHIDSCQTIFTEPSQMVRPDPVLPGHGRGGFVVMCGIK
jgi:SAM-dependent methyltransferase